MTDPTTSRSSHQNHDDPKVRLSRVDLLEPLSSEDIDWLNQRTPQTCLAPGQIFFTPRLTTANVVYLLLEGRMRLYQMVKGNELTLEVVEAGKMFGEASLAEEPQGMYAQATEPSHVGLLGLSVLKSLVHKNPEVGLKAMKLLSQRVLFYRSNMVDLGLKGVSARLANRILHLLETEGIVMSNGYLMIPTRYTHDQLAAMIGAKRVAVTRAFGDLQHRGAVKIRRRYIHVWDKEILRHLANAA